MGWWSNVTKPVRQAANFIKNPADALIPDTIRESSAYQNVIKPAVKVGAGAATGFVTSGFNPAGAIAGGAASIAGGGLSDKGFQPIPNIVIPGGAGLVTGAVQGTGVGGDIVGTSAPAAPAATGAGGGLTGVGAGQSPTSVIQGMGGSLGISSGSSVLDAVVKYGAPALDILSGATGLMASAKEKDLAQQAQAAALSGNSNALNQALESLKREINLRKGAALASMGASGFVTRRGSGGTLLDMVENSINTDATLREKYTRMLSENDRNRINAQAMQAQAGIESRKMGAIKDIGSGVLDAYGRYTS